jgi:hypothetical protein
MTARWTSSVFAIVSLFASNRAEALCDRLNETELYNRAAVVADAVVEEVRDGPRPSQVIVAVRVVRALKGVQPGERLEVMSAYNQAEMIRFPSPGIAFHLHAVGGPDLYRTNECLYFGGPPAVYKAEALIPYDGLGWCDLTVCQNLRLPKNE